METDMNKKNPAVTATAKRSRRVLDDAFKTKVVAGSEFTQLRIVDMQGRQLHIWNGQALQTQLDLHQIPAGIYSLTAQGSHGLQTTRFVKP